MIILKKLFNFFVDFRKGGKINFKDNYLNNCQIYGEKLKFLNLKLDQKVL